MSPLEQKSSNLASYPLEMTPQIQHTIEQFHPQLSIMTQIYSDDKQISFSEKKNLRVVSESYFFLCLFLFPMLLERRLFPCDGEGTHPFIYCYNKLKSRDTSKFKIHVISHHRYGIQFKRNIIFHPI